MININTLNTENTLTVYYATVKETIYAKLALISNIELQEFIRNNFEGIICGKPNRLQELHEEFIKKWSKEDLAIVLGKDKDGKDKKRVLFEYNSLSDNHKYKLMESLGIRACPYCNAAYIITNKIGKVRPQIDHYFSQIDHPILALSFYNMIPSCADCNQKKGKKPFDITTHIHPYIDNILSEFRFIYELNSLSDLSIKLEQLSENNKVFSSFKDLKIEGRYNGYRHIVEDMRNISVMYSDDYIDSLQKICKDTSIDRSTVYRYAFGTEYDEVNFHKYPLSKLKKDIALQLNLIDI